MWPVEGGSEKSYVEFQRTQAEVKSFVRSFLCLCDVLAIDDGAAFGHSQLELWENGMLRERMQQQPAQPDSLTPLQQMQRAPGTPLVVDDARANQATDLNVIHNNNNRRAGIVLSPLAAPMLRRIARPQELRSEFVLLPYSWKIVDSN